MKNLLIITPPWENDGFGNVGYSGSARVNLWANIRDWLISPPIDLGDGSIPYQLSFDATLTPFFGTESASFGVDDSVFVIISTDNGLTWSDDNKLHQWHDGVSLSNSAEFFAIDLSSYTGVVKIAFYGYSPIGNEDVNFYLDNFLVSEKPPCVQPLSLSVTSLTDTSADLIWSSTETAFAIEYGLSGFTQDTSNIINVTNDTVSISDLQPNTDYDYYVRTYCADGDTSEWTGPYSFTTLCEVLTVPTSSEQFNSVPPACWDEGKAQIGDSTVISYEPTQWTTDNFGNTGSISARLNVYSARNDWLISPSINLGAGQNYQLEFDLTATNFYSSSPAVFGNDDTLRVLISTDNGSTWSGQNTLDLWHSSNTISNQTEHKVYDLSSYSGVVKFAFYAKSTDYQEDFNVYIDNFKVNKCTQYFSIADTACMSYTSPVSGVEYTTTGTYYDTIPNASCDSVYIINLTVNPTSSYSTTIIECDTLVSPSGNIYTQTGTYYDTIPNMHSCDSVIETNLSILYVDLSVNQTQNIFLGSNVSDPAATYQWVDCSDLSTISGATSADYTVTAFGNYACRISIGNCTQLSECISVISLDTTTTIAQYKKSDVKVYPNPNNGLFTLELSEKPQGDLHLSISNTLGQLIHSQKITSASNTISLDGVDKGIYIMNLSSSSHSIKTRIVVD